MKKHLFEKYMSDLRVYFAEEELILKEEMVKALCSDDPEYRLFNVTKVKKASKDARFDESGSSELELVS